MPTQTVNICAKFHRNLSTKYRDIASRKFSVNRQPDGIPENQMPLTTYFWQRRDQSNITVAVILLSLLSS